MCESVIGGINTLTPCCGNSDYSAEPGLALLTIAGPV